MQNAGLATNLANNKQRSLHPHPESAIHLCSILYMAFYFRNTPCGMFAYYDKFKEDRESKSVNTKEEAVLKQK